MIIKNALYINKHSKLSHGNIFIKNGKIDVITENELSKNHDEEMIDASEYLDSWISQCSLS